MPSTLHLPDLDHPVAVTSLLDRIDRSTPSSDGARRTKLATGFDPLDLALSGGFSQHEFVIVGGRPGVGKTIATLQWARHLASTGRRVVYACYEHSPETLLSRLLALEIGMLALETWELTLDADRATVLEDVCAGAWRAKDPAGRHPLVRAARVRLAEYGDRLMLLPASPATTGVSAIAAAVESDPDEPTVLFVDYIQKVPLDPRFVATADERVAAVSSALRDMALRHPLVVVAIAAAVGPSLAVRRIRLHHLDSASVLGYEADVVILLNEKRLAVSKVHLSYDTAQAERFSREVVFSIEKNRGGPASIDVEFEKDFPHFRFKPRGAFVAERLVDDVVLAE